MHSHNPQIRQDGRNQLRPHVEQHLEEVITEFNREADHDLRCSLLELIGQARSADTLPVLVEQLHGNDESLRSWAVKGLEQLDTTAARYQLHRARTTGLIP